MNDHYIETPGYWSGAIVEMTPLWLDETTLQVALSDNDRWCTHNSYATRARLANVRKWVPDLSDALRWCAERRLATKLVCVEGAMNERLARTLRDWQARNSFNSLSKPADTLLSPGYRFASHQLQFKNWKRAFEFRMRWY
ncbi:MULTISPECIES: hypothetical protein [unclassified Methylobacterium]|uniref:hypothetical protein n=1 Tax=unclassified Methylobacterium TaxID=2615210 RepID=UPI0022699CBF|nr:MULTISPECIES: hypothetical protein [unclassified Methylobacterium]